MIKTLWSTNVLHEYRASEATDDFLQDIIAIGNEYEMKHPEAHVPVAMRKLPEVSYNLLADDRPSCQLFKSMLKQRMIEIASAEGFHNPENVRFEAVTNMRRFGPNEYAKPHNHRSVDYVAVLFLQVGVTDDGTNVHQKMAGNRLHLIDPMPMRNRWLNHNMLHAISPKPGTFVIHPAGLFHTTELNLSDIDLIALVTNVKVIDDVRNYVEL
jgi:Putative 2OG-Fe(II) oxygenase